MTCNCWRFVVCEWRREGLEDKQPISTSHEEHYHFHSCSFERLQPDVFLGVEPHERGVCSGVLLYKQTKCRKSVFMGPPLRRRGGVKLQLRLFFSSELHGVERSASRYGRFTPQKKSPQCPASLDASNKTSCPCRESKNSLVFHSVAQSRRHNGTRRQK